MTEKATLTHLNQDGHAHMVDVGDKEITRRNAAARARVRMSAETFDKLCSGATPKGDVLAAARIAGIQASKLTPQLIPLCHAIQLTRVEVSIALEDGVAIVDATAEARDRTGVEMEAMVAASTAALTLYDMLKAIDRSMSFDVCLLEKSGGRSGHFTRPPNDDADDVKNAKEPSQR
ncbi:MAG TPA: cyclic pyranopterin monophosphate synthase MoaC [Labilithrix sp.]|nr:cyclic pyranopterin monophosphate synthase MoaC [Labilithrix sp.]